MLLFHAIAKVSVELANLVFPLLKELAASKYLREVLINLFDLSHGIEFCLDRKLAQLFLSQLSLQVVILLFELLQQATLLFILLVANSKITLEVLYHKHQLLLSFGLWLATTSTFLGGACAESCSSRNTTTSCSTTATTWCIFSIALALSDLLFDFGAQEFTLIEAGWPLLCRLSDGTTLLSWVVLSFLLCLLVLLLRDL